MRLQEDGIRNLVSAALVSYMIVVAAYLWFIDLLAKQEEFGFFLATELAALSMLIYIGRKPNYTSVKKSWLLLGCASIVFVLTMALLK